MGGKGGWDEVDGEARTWAAPMLNLLLAGEGDGGDCGGVRHYAKGGRR